MKKPLETARETPEWQDSYVSKFELFELIELLSRHPPRVQLGWPGQQIERRTSLECEAEAGSRISGSALWLTQLSQGKEQLALSSLINCCCF